MSLTQPPSSAARFAARRRNTSPGLQTAVLGLGLLAAAGLAWGIVEAAGNPWWVLACLAAGAVLLLGLVATTLWSSRAALAGAPAPRIGVGVYATGVLAAGAVTAYARFRQGDAPALAWAVLGGLAVLALAATAWLRVGRGARGRRLERLRGGRRAVGTVTDDGLAEFATTPNRKLATLTVSFPDHLGNERWVRVSAVQAPGTPLAVGDRVDVWFDPAHPDDLSRILVEGGNGESVVVPGEVLG